VYLRYLRPLPFPTIIPVFTNQPSTETNPNHAHYDTLLAYPVLFLLEKLRLKMFQVMVFLESMTVQGLKKYLLLSGFDMFPVSV